LLHVETSDTQNKHVYLDSNKMTTTDATGRRMCEGKAVAYPGIFSGRGVPPGIFFVVGVQQIQLRTEDRENGDLRAVAP
jgi:hypothetical protein